MLIRIYQSFSVYELFQTLYEYLDASFWSNYLKTQHVKLHELGEPPQKTYSFPKPLRPPNLLLLLLLPRFLEADKTIEFNIDNLPSKNDNNDDNNE